MAGDVYKQIEIDGLRYYGKHMLLTGVHCNNRLLDIAAIKEFLGILVDDIKMVAYGKPVVERFGEGIYCGISAVQLILTSAIMLHTNDAQRDLYLDVFSCKGFSEDDVVRRVRQAFAPQEVNWQVVLRR